MIMAIIESVIIFVCFDVQRLLLLIRLFHDVLISIVIVINSSYNTSFFGVVRNII